jgi:hypothetical protein
MQTHRDRSENSGREAVARLVGARLTSINFVLDYLILGFDERGALTTLVWPEVVLRERVVKFGDDDYRNALCRLIEEVVRAADCSEDETITFSFGTAELRIPLKQRQSPGERAIFTAPKHFLHVWT